MGEIETKQATRKILLQRNYVDIQYATSTFYLCFKSVPNI